MLLERVISSRGGRLGSKEKVVPNHGPDARQVSMGEQNLLIVSTKKLVADVDQAGGHVDPHECEVPLQRASKPTTKRKRLGPVQKVLLWDLWAEAGERLEDLQTASNQHKQRNCIYPMSHADDARVLVNCLSAFTRLNVFHRHGSGCHFASPSS